MTYFKIILNNLVIGVSSSNFFCQFQNKHKIIIWCNANTAEYLWYNNKLYHDTWLAPIKSNEYPYEIAQICAISQGQYNTLKQEIDEGNTPTINEEQEDIENNNIIIQEQNNNKPIKTKFQFLEEQMKILQDKNTLLEECLLELSEIVYA